MKNKRPDPKPGEVWIVDGTASNGRMILRALHGAVVLITSTFADDVANVRVLQGDKAIRRLNKTWLGTNISDPGIAALYGIDLPQLNDKE